MAAMEDGVNPLTPLVDRRGLDPRREEDRMLLQTLVKQFADKETRCAVERERNNGRDGRICELGAIIERIAARLQDGDIKIRDNAEDIKALTKSVTDLKDTLAKGNEATNKRIDMVMKILWGIAGTIGVAFINNVAAILREVLHKAATP